MYKVKVGVLRPVQQPGTVCTMHLIQTSILDGVKTPLHYFSIVYVYSLLHNVFHSST